jgi:hypothetical protein
MNITHTGELGYVLYIPNEVCEFYGNSCKTDYFSLCGRIFQAKIQMSFKNYIFLYIED